MQAGTAVTRGRGFSQLAVATELPTLRLPAENTLQTQLDGFSSILGSLARAEPHVLDSPESYRHFALTTCEDSHPQGDQGVPDP